MLASKYEESSMKNKLIFINIVVFLLFLIACSSIDLKHEDEFKEIWELSKNIETEDEWVDSCIPERAYNSRTPNEKTYWVNMGFRPDCPEHIYKKLITKYHNQFIKKTKVITIEPLVSWSFTKEFPKLCNKNPSDKEKLLTDIAMAKIIELQKINTEKYHLEYLSAYYRLYFDKKEAKIVYLFQAPIGTNKAVSNSINSLL